jgi:adenylate cyclase
VSKKKVVRRLSALLVADLVGYVGKMQADETSTHNQVQADFNALLVPRVRAHHGRVVKTMGDGLLAEFSSVVDSVQCAVEIQRAMGARRPSSPEKPRFQYRIAINLGDVIIENDDVFGDGVNLAARLQTLAEPGGILLSGEAYRHVKGKTKVAFEDLGTRQLKGVAEPIQVFRVAPKAVKSGRGQVPTSAAASSPRAAPSIAVLPLDDLNRDPDQSYFSDGITNDLITDLSKFSELFVIASHTAFTYKDKAVNIQDIGRELGVRYVVEGSVQRAGDRIRINIQLIETGSGRHLWAERYDRSTGDFFQLQDEIVQTVIGTLVTRVHLSEIQRVLSSKPDKFQAYDVYLRGRAVWQQWTSQTNREAQELFKRAIELDPGFALAYGYLSYTYVQAWLGGWERSPKTLERAKKLAQKAVELGPSEFDNHWSLAAAYLHGREFEKAMAAYQRALELNPNSPNLLVDMAEALVYVGRVDEAVKHVERAMRLNPIYPDWYLWTMGIVLYHAGEYERALTSLMKTGNPPNLARRHLAATNVRLGRLAEARRVAAKFMENDPDYTLDRERVWPYKDESMREALMADLRRAGLPDNVSNENKTPRKRKEGRHG